MFRRPIALALLAAFVAAGCSSNPAAPSPPSVDSGGGAIIAGSVLGGGGSSSSTSATSSATNPSAIVVSIVGTDISGTVDAAGRFSLANVPSGTVNLLVSGPGFSGIVTVENVSTGETIELTVRVQGSGVSVASEQRGHDSGNDDRGHEDQIEGLVQSLPPTTADGTLVVNTWNVMTTADTQFFMGSRQVTFAELEIGQRVHVKGQGNGGNFTARIIDIQNVRDDSPVNVNGKAENVTGAEDDFEFMVDVMLVKGDAATAFFGGSVFADLVNGARVEVKGLQRDGFIYAARIHVNSDDDDDDGDDGGDDGDDDDEFEEDGPITAISGAAPALVVTVGGVDVTLNAATQVRRRGDEVPMTVLQVGLNVEIDGRKQADGSVIAKKVNIEDETLDADFEGTVVAPSGGPGTCPDLTFTIGARTVVTDGVTDFKQIDCSAVIDGARIKVRGVLQPDATIYATRIQPKR